MRYYTRRGDDGTTGLRSGGRVAKDDPAIELVGSVDEAQAALGLVRAHAERGGWLDDVLTAAERDLWILMAEVATPVDRRASLEPGVTSVTHEMVERLEAQVDDITSSLELAPHFAVPGENVQSARLDVARTTVRRAERRAVASAVPGSHVVEYLNRLSTLCWALARRHEHEHPVQHRH